MLRPHSNNHDSENCPLCVLVFRWEVRRLCFLTKRPWQVSRNDKTVFEFVSHCPCPLPLNTFQMDLGHAFMFGWYKLMNPRRCRLHPLCLPQRFCSTTSRSLSTRLFFLTKRSRPSSVLKARLVLAQTFFEPSPANRRRCNLENSDETTDRNTFEPGCLSRKQNPTSPKTH